jgi:hypothetical protein
MTAPGSGLRGPRHARRTLPWLPTVLVLSATTVTLTDTAFGLVTIGFTFAALAAAWTARRALGPVAVRPEDRSPRHRLPRSPARHRRAVRGCAP